nr:glutathione S-transferase family protein [uncultured Acidocella sp.]
MLDLYAFATPNSIKVPIALEELGLPYRLNAVNVRQGEQRAPEFLALNPNGKVPVLVAPAENGGSLVLTESAAILVHLAETSGRLLPASGETRARVFEQLFFHASGLGPAFGQSGFFQRQAAEPQKLATERFAAEARRTLGVLNDTLSRHDFVAGDEYSIADIAHFGWIWRREFAGVDFTEAPYVARWYENLAARPAVQRAIARIETLTPRG